MFGYHYTSLQNWKQIQKYGLEPYHITYLYSSPWAASKKGIWLWKHKPRSKNHLGNILRVLAIHNTTQVVLLKVKYEVSDLVTWNGQNVCFVHHGRLEKFVYHRNSPAVISYKAIPVERIKLIGQYNAMQIVR